MPIFKKSATGVGPLMPEAYANELELETALVEMPNLLAEIDGPSLAYVARQVNLEGAGILDILLVDSEGTPVVVEVKLARNGESRREVVGQVIDYVSTLTSMTVDELDRAVGGAVEKALRSFAATENQDQEFETLWASIGTNLRAGMARFVIAMDAAPPELQRIVRFLASRSNLRVTLTIIEKYPHGDGTVTFVPRQDATAPLVLESPSTGSRRQTGPELQAVLDAYANLATPGFAAAGQASNFRAIRPAGWPGGLHYEFIKRREGIGVEIHLESKAAQLLTEMVKALAGPPRPEFPYTLEWDPAWSYGPRLFASFQSNSAPDKTALAMKQLIEMTYANITTKLRGA